MRLFGDGLGFKNLTLARVSRYVPKIQSIKKHASGDARYRRRIFDRTFSGVHQCLKQDQPPANNFSHCYISNPAAQTQTRSPPDFDECTLAFR